MRGQIAGTALDARGRTVNSPQPVRNLVVIFETGSEMPAVQYRLLAAAWSAEAPPCGVEAAKREAGRGQSAGGYVAE